MAANSTTTAAIQPAEVSFFGVFTGSFPRLICCCCLCCRSACFFCSYSYSLTMLSKFQKSSPRSWSGSGQPLDILLFLHSSQFLYLPLIHFWQSYAAAYQVSTPVIFLQSLQQLHVQNIRNPRKYIVSSSDDPGSLTWDLWEDCPCILRSDHPGPTYGSA